MVVGVAFTQQDGRLILDRFRAVALVENGEAVVHNDRYCGDIHQTKGMGYDYSRPAGRAAWIFRLAESNVLILTRVMDWSLPCGGHKIGQEREAPITLLREKP